MSTKKEPTIKVCPVCKTEFIPKSNREVYCCPECRIVGNKIVKSNYTKRIKEKLKEYNKEYYKLKRKPKLEAKKPTEKKKYEKICAICGKNFISISKLAKYCSLECKKEAMKKIQKEYRKTDKFKEYQKAYMKSEKYKAIKAKYYKTDKFKEIVKNYRKRKREELLNLN